MQRRYAGLEQGTTRGLLELDNMVPSELVIPSQGKVGMLDLLIKSHWYKCSVSLEGHAG